MIAGLNYSLPAWQTFTGLPANGTQVLDAAGEYVATVMVIPREWDGHVVTHIGYWCHGTSSGEVTVGVKTLTGVFPDLASDYGTATDSASTVATVNALNWVALGTACTLTAGDAVAFVVQRSAGSVTAVGYRNGSQAWTNGTNALAAYSTGTPTSNAVSPAVLAKTADHLLTTAAWTQTTGYPGTTLSCSTNASHQEAVGGKYLIKTRSRLVAVSLYADLNQDTDAVVLYATDGVTELYRATRDTSTNPLWQRNTSGAWVSIPLPVPVWLDPGEYILALRNDTNTTAANAYYMGVAAEVLAANEDILLGRCVTCQGSPSDLSSWVNYDFHSNPTLFMGGLQFDAVENPPMRGRL